MSKAVIKQENKKNIKQVLLNNIVTIIFIIISAIGVFLSRNEITYVYLVNELLNRISRNAFLVLSLIIPIIAGLGLNFGIVVGAMAGQAAIIAVTYWEISGIAGFLLCILLSTPLAALFGYFTGKLYNKTKGQEMIAGLILGFFADGLYQFVFLFLLGGLIPMKEVPMLKPDGIGLRNTIALNGIMGDPKVVGIKYAIENILRINLFLFLILFSTAIVILTLYLINRSNKNVNNKYLKLGFSINIIAVAGVLVLIIAKPLIAKLKLIILPIILIISILNIFITLKYYKNNNEIKNEVYKRYILAADVIIIISALISAFGNKGINSLTIPFVTWTIIGCLCFFNFAIMRTKLGQDFRTIGHNQHIAKVSGINVNTTRIIAVILSTILAAWGQIIFLQNIGIMNTYSSHTQVGMFASAAILIGGASVSKASIWQALLGTILFHSVFIVSPTAGKALFGEAQIGEFFRAFVVYGVIGISLGLHTWKKRKIGN